MSLELLGVNKSFFQGDKKIQVLENVDFKLEQGKTAAVLGPSGVGKSTFLSLLAGLDHPDSGKILIEGREIQDLNEEQMAQCRAESIGFVFQQFHLISHLTALENVSFPPLLLDGGDQNEIQDRAKELLRSVGLAERMDHFPSQLSGGECQRVAIARALIHRPKIVLADEPSGNLDSETGEKVIDLLFSLVKQENSSLVMVTHNRGLADRCDQIFEMAKGQLH